MSFSESGLEHGRAFDFDAIEVWGPELEHELANVIPASASAVLAGTRHEFVEDARDQLLEMVNSSRAEMVSRITAWIEAQSVVVYHGSRLTDDEVLRIKQEGLRTLCARQRIPRLKAILSSHGSWNEIEPQLEATVDAFGRFGVQNGYGQREGQVHATLSRAGLVQSFNHYLTEGPEFDTHVAHRLLGEEGVDLMRAHGVPVLVHLHVPGQVALKATDPLNFRPDPPEMVRYILTAWAWWLADHSHSSARLRVDCGLTFRTDVPPSWIVKIEKLL
jgi:hypothetical protein